MKRTIFLLIIAALLFGTVVFVFAISETQKVVVDTTDMPPALKSMRHTTFEPEIRFEAIHANGTEVDDAGAAERLYYLGVISGYVDEKGHMTFDIDRDMTQLEAAVTVVRLLGAEAEALGMEPIGHYLDVPEWGRPYVDYLYSKGLVTSESAVYFNPSKKININTYMRYVLYALGYSFDGSDYGGELASFVGAKLGLCSGSFRGVTRGDAFLIAYLALNTEVKGTGKLLSEIQVEDKRLDYNDAVFLLWSDDEEKSRQYMTLSGYQIGDMLPDGYYEIKISSSEHALNVLANGNNGDYEGVGVTVWADTDDVSQRFRLERTEKGTYVIYAACSRGGYNRVLGFNPYNGQAALYHSSSEYAAEFYIRSTGDGDGTWYIVPVKKPLASVGVQYGYAVMALTASESADVKWYFRQEGTVTEDGDEVALFPGENLYVTQGAYEDFSHGSQNALDICTISGRAFSPFTGTIRQILGYNQCNAVFVESNSKVRYADGTLDYMTVVFMHDNYVYDLYVGQVLRQGEYFYDMGTAGYAVGSHIHIYVLRGKYDYSTPFLGSGDIYVEDALSLLPDTIINMSYGLNWRVYTGN